MAQRAERRATRTARLIHELPWLWRKLAVRNARSMLRRAPVEGLLGYDRDGQAIWADGYPEALTRP